MSASKKRTQKVDPGLATSVKALRNALGWTQEDVADRGGFERTYMIGIEKGDKSNSWLLRRAMAKAFGLSLDDFTAYTDGAIDLRRVLELRERRISIGDPTERRVELDARPAALVSVLEHFPVGKWSQGTITSVAEMMHKNAEPWTEASIVEWLNKFEGANRVVASTYTPPLGNVTVAEDELDVPWPPPKSPKKMAK